MNRISLIPFLLCTTPLSSHAQKIQQPHIVLILCDDMGFSDLGCYGSEIHTPNIDKLAQDGIRFSQFKNTGRSCPSRAALLTGRYQHQVGMGWMAEVDEHRPGYRGQIDKEYPTIAEIMKAGGYRTYRAGNGMSLPLEDMMLPTAVILCKEDSTGITVVCTEEEATINPTRYTMI